mmetsp:Transcript_41041/g.86858  ORF Transcript_41041/g.86858 Transcript_41041/m.86858 type:complete len:181 (+) Transcript_41041:81-623(+)
MTYVCERCRKPVEDPSGHFCEHCNAFEACQWEDDGESSSSVGPFDPAPQFDDQSTCAGSSIYGQSDFSDGSSEWTFNLGPFDGAQQNIDELSTIAGSDSTYEGSDGSSEWRLGGSDEDSELGDQDPKGDVSGADWSTDDLQDSEPGEDVPPADGEASDHEEGTSCSLYSESMEMAESPAE